MALPGKKGVCQTKCNDGYTSNGSDPKKCISCDTSCDNCLDNGNVDDYKQCVACSKTHPYRLEDLTGATRYCLNTCNQGIFDRPLFQKPENSPELTCAKCRDPCKGCIESETQCTSCY